MLKNTKSGVDGFMGRHPVLANIVVIILIAFLGIWIVFLCLQLFTKHGESDIVPAVENMSYTQAVKTLHENGFRVDIRDSIYKEEVKPGFVIEQFPKSGAHVKPGRKVFLYINAVHPREVVIDEDNNPAEDALRGFSFRQGMARLEELRFKNIKVVKILGDNDCIVKITANGKVVKKKDKTPVNSRLVVEVYDGKLGELRDSLQNEEYLRYVSEPEDGYTDDDTTDNYSGVPDGEDPETEDPEPIYVQ